MQAHALAYAAWKLPVFPCHWPVQSGGGWRCSCGRPDCKQAAKHPLGRLVPNGLLDASTDPARIRPWFGADKPNVAARTGMEAGVFVVDVDAKSGGEEALDALERENGPLPPTWRVLTGGGGLHVYFRHPARPVKTSASQLARGVDTRGEGGYVLMPPSLHMSGRPYAWSVDHHPEDVPLADAPPWLLKRLDEMGGGTGPDGKPEAKPSTFWQALSEEAGEGTRNNTITQLAGHLLRRYVEPHLAMELVQAWNLSHCAPPLDEDEVAKAVRSIASKELRRRQHAA